MSDVQHVVKDSMHAMIDITLGQPAGISLIVGDRQQLKLASRESFSFKKLASQESPISGSSRPW